jgi:hypothetical protein
MDLLVTDEPLLSLTCRTVSAYHGVQSLCRHRMDVSTLDTRGGWGWCSVQCCCCSCYNELRGAESFSFDSRSSSQEISLLLWNSKFIAVLTRACHHTLFFGAAEFSSHHYTLFNLGHRHGDGGNKLLRNVSRCIGYHTTRFSIPEDSHLHARRDS